MITCTLGSLFDLVDVAEGPNVLDRYEKINGLNSITTKWKIGKTTRAARIAINEAVGPRSEILAKYGTQASGNVWNIPNDKMADYLKEIAQLRGTKVELVADPVELASLDGTDISPADLMKLADANFIVEKQ